MSYHDGLGILELIIAAVDLSVAGTTASIQHDLLKNSAKKISATEQLTLQQQEALKDQEILQRQQAQQAKNALESDKDYGVQQLVKLSLGTLIALSAIGLGIIYIVR